MAQHDNYGKKLLKSAAGAAFEAYGQAISVDYGAGRGAQIDGVIGGTIAVEIESRVSKQIRGAVLDLICHHCPKKLLIILPVHADNPEVTATQCRNILSRFFDAKNFRVVVACGSGDNERFEVDVLIVRNALCELNFEMPFT